MKKAVIIAQSKDSNSVVNKLSSLGLLHVENEQLPKSQDISAVKDDMELVVKTVLTLSRPEFSSNTAQDKSKDIGDWKFITKHVIDCAKRLAQLQEYSHRLINNISQWQEWGDFDPQAIENLAKKNIFLRLYQLPIKEIKNFPSGVIVKVISQSKGTARCATFSREKIEIPFKEIPLPKMSLKKMQERLWEDKEIMTYIVAELKKHVIYKDKLISIRKSLEKDLELQEALHGMGQAGNLSYIKGYIPFDKVEMLVSTAKSEKLGLVISDPGEEDNVPTLLRNPKWVSLIQPLFKAIEISPGYRELDISLLFIISLSLFFGMIIGDAGYGLVYFLLTYWAQKKLGNKIPDKRVFYLLYLFSSCAICWGLLTGTVFGQEWYLKSGYKALVPILNDTKFIQAFCFFLGTLHLTLGQAWQGLRKIPSIVALSDVGWVSLLWAAFFWAKRLILSDPLPFFVKWLIVLGLALVILFSSPKSNIIKTIASGLVTALLNVMNSFTDVVSYIRLFAVGLASVAVSDSFNKIAFDIGGAGGFVALGICVFILFMGHALNIILGPMSVLIHGVRLNVLEFSSHLDIKWSGFEYKPLTLRS